MRKASDINEAWEMEEKFIGKPHAWIQWKGTDVCMDVHCKCGAHCHVDAIAAYQVKCPECGTIYACASHIELIEVESDSGSIVVDALSSHC
ncbi:hypothetical protein [Vibrio rotiferianus]|uniref:hypothetical protein n=1 Tax=Vibrio rotiferianus TaxID=190895 RepID=UPI001C716E9D|nr:hypothetical protein [Vibrio rotiferianus]